MPMQSNANVKQYKCLAMLRKTNAKRSYSVISITRTVCKGIHTSDFGIVLYV